MNNPRISIIVAVDYNFAIGKDNKLPFKVSEDMTHFKTTTMGHAVIMGRKTYESIGKPLPGRKNVVLTRGKSYMIKGDVDVSPSLELAITDCGWGYKELFIIGGGEVYLEALKIADQIFLTQIHTDVVDPDTYFPDIRNDKNWVLKEVLTKDHCNQPSWVRSVDGPLFRILHYVRNEKANQS